MSKQAGVSLTHGFFDCHCYNGASAALDSDETMRHVRRHRCLQHSKENLRSEGRRKDPVSGDAQLSSDFFSWDLYCLMEEHRK